MTYCVGLLVREGLVMISDTRTNAGIDNIASFRKLHVFEDPGERVLTTVMFTDIARSTELRDTLGESVYEGLRETHDDRWLRSPGPSVPVSRTVTRYSKTASGG